jgi:hypothetical protein
MSTTPEFLAVHGLAVKKAGSVEDVARVAGLSLADTEEALQEAVARGRVLGAKGKYMVTPAGRAWLDEQYPVVYAQQRASGELSAAYGDFEVVNRELLALMTRWQTITVGSTAVPNDHTDPDYDAKVLDELAGLHEQALPTLEAFTAQEPRLSAHLDALEEAQRRIAGGDRDYVSGARIPSYHTVWFELHEDLLRILGRERES